MKKVLMAALAAFTMTTAANASTSVLNQMSQDQQDLRVKLCAEGHQHTCTTVFGDYLYTVVDGEMVAVPFKARHFSSSDAAVEYVMAEIITTKAQAAIDQMYLDAVTERDQLLLALGEMNTEDALQALSDIGARIDHLNKAEKWLSKQTDGFIIGIAQGVQPSNDNWHGIFGLSRDNRGRGGDSYSPADYVTGGYYVDEDGPQYDGQIPNGIYVTDLAEEFDELNAGILHAIGVAIEDAYNTGYDAGYADGYRDGFADGIASVN